MDEKAKANKQEQVGTRIDPELIDFFYDNFINEGADNSSDKYRALMEQAITIEEFETLAQSLNPTYASEYFTENINRFLKMLINASDDAYANAKGEGKDTSEFFAVVYSIARSKFQHIVARVQSKEKLSYPYANFCNLSRGAIERAFPSNPKKVVVSRESELVQPFCAPEDRGLIESFLDELDVVQQEIFIETVLNNMSYQQVAIQVGWNRSKTREESKLLKYRFKEFLYRSLKTSGNQYQ